MNQLCDTVYNIMKLRKKRKMKWKIAGNFIAIDIEKIWRDSVRTELIFAKVGKIVTEVEGFVL